MSFLAIMMLTAGIHSAVPATVPARAARSEAAIIQQMSAQMETARRQAVHKALATSSRAFNLSLRRRLTAMRIRDDHSTSGELDRLTLTRHAKKSLDLRVARNERALRRQAVSRALADISRDVRDSLASRRSAIRARQADGKRLVASHRGQAK